MRFFSSLLLVYLGLSGILTEQATGWYYKHNQGKGKFEQARLVSPKPSLSSLGGQLQLADLDADGGKQIVSYDADGYFELSDDNEWETFCAHTLNHHSLIFVERSLSVNRST
ncbi:hypothetical protein G7074_15610 [Pedobacter sp. HDW13]|uniref:hypothetical protein n=1 Tax=Pedobacter sp. HDW13 TaxID=2714940 RepID=UPI00140CDC10|nr:hypothetical protein [Pedobacter sp. HDW13]QIL40567.1 hypothetical protein G7074_15610 [Pedobacter sp. HDW13]